MKPYNNRPLTLVLIGAFTLLLFALCIRIQLSYSDSTIYSVFDESKGEYVDYNSLSSFKKGAPIEYAFFQGYEYSFANEELYACMEENYPDHNGERTKFFSYFGTNPIGDYFDPPPSSRVKDLATAVSQAKSLYPKCDYIVYVSCAPVDAEAFYVSELEYFTQNDEITYSDLQSCSHGFLTYPFP